MQEKQGADWEEPAALVSAPHVTQGRAHPSFLSHPAAEVHAQPFQKQGKPYLMTGVISWGYDLLRARVCFLLWKSKQNHNEHAHY